MVRLTRAQQQQRTRAIVLRAARDEFAERGFTDAKIDRIADRAELTRGAVYSNFPSKRALYLAVLAAQDDRVTEDSGPASPAPASVPEALRGFARLWLERLPLAGDAPAQGRMKLRSLDGVLTDDRTRSALAELARMEALLLGLALESVPGAADRMVRLAELTLTLLAGSARLAETAPGFGDPFDQVRGCEHLAALDLADRWDPPHLAYLAPAEPCDLAWEPPTGLVDEISGDRLDLTGDGLIALYGIDRLGSAEELVRAGVEDQLTVVVLTSDPDEIGRLVRLRLADLIGCLRQVFGPGRWSELRLAVADAQAGAGCGVSEPGDDTETALRIRNGRVVARAGGRGAGHAAATFSRPPATTS